MWPKSLHGIDRGDLPYLGGFLERTASAGNPRPAGRRVRELPVAAATRTAGRVAVVWDGASDAGEQVAVGSYFFRLTTPDGESQGKAVRLR